MSTTAAREVPDGERLARLETRVENLDQRMLALEQAIRDLSAKVDRNFLWTLGIIITMWVTVMLAVAGLYAVVLTS